MIENVANDLMLISNDLIDIAMQEPPERLLSLQNIKLAVESMDFTNEPKELMLDIVNELIDGTKNDIDKALQADLDVEDIDIDIEGLDFSDVDVDDFDLSNIDLSEIQFDEDDLIGLDLDDIN